MMRQIKRYNLKELAEKLTQQPLSYVDVIPTFDSIFSEYISASGRAEWQSGYSKELWEHVWYRHLDDVCIVSSDEQFDNNCKQLVSNFYSIYRSNKDYYFKIISLYESKQNNLLDGLKRETHAGSVASDTPQNYNIDDYQSDGYASQAGLQHATETYDNESIINRLNQIRAAYKNFYSEYAKKFDVLFVSELNYKLECDDDEY